jgi:hypothetical protein
MGILTLRLIQLYDALASRVAVRNTLDRERVRSLTSFGQCLTKFPNETLIALKLAERASRRIFELRISPDDVLPISTQQSPIEECHRSYYRQMNV